MGKGATPLSESEFVSEIVTRLGDEVPAATVKKVVKALKEEAVDCLANGYKITLTSFLIMTPTAVKGRRKGTKVRNPFDNTEKTLRSDEPDKFKVKAKASSTIVKSFPSIKSADGQALHKQLTPAKKKKK